MDTNSPTTPKRAATAERRKNALAYRIGGKTFQEIGDLLGITAQSAHALVVKAIDEISNKTSENAEQLRQLELERLSFMRNAVWGSVIKGDIQAINTGIKLSESIRKLQGLDAPVKTDITSGGQALTIKIIKASDDRSEDENKNPV